MSKENAAAEVTGHQCGSPAPTAKHEKRLRLYWQRRSHVAFNDLLDLDLEAWGFVQREATRYASYTLTAAGLELLARQRAEIQERGIPHHSMGERLTQFLRTNGRLAWCNIEFTVNSPNAAGAPFPGRARLRTHRHRAARRVFADFAKAVGIDLVERESTCSAKLKGRSL